MTDLFSIYQLEDDPDTYGSDAGKFIVTSTDHEREYSDPMSKEDAERFAALLALADRVKRIDFKYAVNRRSTKLMAEKVMLSICVNAA